MSLNERGGRRIERLLIMAAIISGVVFATIYPVTAMFAIPARGASRLRSSQKGQVDSSEWRGDGQHWLTSKHPHLGLTAASIQQARDQNVGFWSSPMTGFMAQFWEGVGRRSSSLWFLWLSALFDLLVAVVFSLRRGAKAIFSRWFSIVFLYCLLLFSL